MCPVAQLIEYIEKLDRQHFRTIVLVWKIAVEKPMQCVPSPKKRETNANIADTRNVKHIPAINVMDEYGK